MLDPMGGLFWPAAKLLVVSDLHLEKGSSFARKGSLLPPWDTQVTLDRLTLMLRRYSPEIVVTLGDSFHDPDASGRLPNSQLARLKAMTDSHRFIWVLGNHDPNPPVGIGGEWMESFRFRSLVFRHEAAGGVRPAEIVGHHHPKATIQARGATITRSCFVLGTNRLMMPAFGAYTGGLSVGDPAIARLFPTGCRVFLLGSERLYSFEVRKTRRPVEPIDRPIRLGEAYPSTGRVIRGNPA